MAPKKKGKGGGAADANKGISEAAKAIYELQITDLNRKLATLRAEFSKVETKLVETEIEMKKLDEDRADVIAYLERTLSARTKEIGVLQAKIIEMDNEKEKEIQVFKDQVDQVKREYKVMRQDLSSQLKLMIGKLSSLEEFRAQRNDLMEKYERQEQRLSEQEERHKKTLYEAERKFIIGKDTLKKEMENRLIQLSNDFQKATEMRIATTTHRVIHENIALNNEFDFMFKTLSTLEKENKEIKDHDKQLALSVDILETIKNTTLSKTMIQENLIHRLTKEHSKMVEKLLFYLNIEHKLNERTEELNTAANNLKASGYIIKHLNQLIYIARCQRYNVETELKNTLLEKNRLQDIIYNATMTIHHFMEEKTINKARSKMRALLHILERIDEEQPQRALSLSTIVTTMTEGAPELSYIELPQLKPLRYKRNVENKTTSVTSSLKYMPEFIRSEKMEGEEDKEMEEISTESIEESIEEAVSSSDDALSILDMTLPTVGPLDTDLSSLEEAFDEYAFYGFFENIGESIKGEGYSETKSATTFTPLTASEKDALKS